MTCMCHHNILRICQEYLSCLIIILVLFSFCSGSLLRTICLDREVIVLADYASAFME